MASRDEALAIINEWSGSHALLDCFVVIPGPRLDEHGEMMRMAKSFLEMRVSEVSPESVTLRPSRSGEAVTLPLPLEADFWCSQAEDLAPISLPSRDVEYGRRVEWEARTDLVGILVILAEIKSRPGG